MTMTQREYANERSYYPRIVEKWILQGLIVLNPDETVNVLESDRRIAIDRRKNPCGLKKRAQ
ncbi:MAG: hypothetical protein ACKOPH_02780 [Methylocystis sp.]